MSSWVGSTVIEPSTGRRYRVLGSRLNRGLGWMVHLEEESANQDDRWVTQKELDLWVRAAVEMMLYGAKNRKKGK